MGRPTPGVVRVDRCSPRPIIKAMLKPSGSMLDAQ